MKTSAYIFSDKSKPPGNDAGDTNYTQTYITYVIQPDDNLSQLAKKFNTTRQTLLTLNHLTEPAILHSGQTLRIPESL